MTVTAPECWITATATNIYVRSAARRRQHPSDTGPGLSDGSLFFVGLNSSGAGLGSGAQAQRAMWLDVARSVRQAATSVSEFTIQGFGWLVLLLCILSNHLSLFLQPVVQTDGPNNETESRKADIDMTSSNPNTAPLKGGACKFGSLEENSVATKREAQSPRCPSKTFARCPKLET